MSLEQPEPLPFSFLRLPTHLRRPEAAARTRREPADDPAWRRRGCRILSWISSERATDVLGASHGLVELGVEIHLLISRILSWISSERASDAVEPSWIGRVGGRDPSSYLQKKIGCYFPSSSLTFKDSAGASHVSGAEDGETYNGHLVNCDTWMNIHLREVICASKDGDRFWRMPECYIRGNTIKYLRAPDEVIDKVQEETNKTRSDRKPPGVGRGGEEVEKMEAVEGLPKALGAASMMEEAKEWVLVVAGATRSKGGGGRGGGHGRG